MLCQFDVGIDATSRRHVPVVTLHVDIRVVDVILMVVSYQYQYMQLFVPTTYAYRRLSLDAGGHTNRHYGGVTEHEVWR